jgi:hypothetical protein
MAVDGLWELMTDGKGAKRKPDGTVDRSSFDWQMANALRARVMLTRGECLAVFLHPKWFVGEKTRDHGIKYARLTIAKAYQGHAEPKRAATDLSKQLMYAERNDAGNAECFEAMHESRTRYDHIQKCWMLWDGVRWVNDFMDETTQLALDTVHARKRVIQAELDKLGTIDDSYKKDPHKDQRDDLERYYHWITGCGNWGKLQAMKNTATSSKALRTRIEFYDTSPMLANAQNMTLDLTTGGLTRPGVVT